MNSCQVAVSAEDRKRAWEQVHDASDSSLELKKGRPGSDVFQFDCIDETLQEIEISCKDDNDDNARAHSTSACSATMPARSPPNLFNMATASTATRNGLTPVLAQFAPVEGRTPTPSKYPLFAGPQTAADRTPNPVEPLSSPYGVLQTLHARALPLSPFEAGPLPNPGRDDDSPRNPFASDSDDDDVSVSAEHAPADQVAVGSGKTSPEDESPAFLSYVCPGERTDNSNAGSFHFADELEGQLALMHDLPATSQGASQGSSLADTKVLKSSGRQLGASSELGRITFGFSKGFQYVARLGDTKRCTVYLVQAAEARFAIKELKRPFSSRLERAELTHEISISANLPPHKHVVQCICGWQEQRKLHIQFELCEGGSLENMLRSGALCSEGSLLDEQMVWTILGDIANGLAHLHGHGVLHMDVKPDNVYVHGSGLLKVGDLGLAVRIPAPAGWQEGDGRYVAPELLARASTPTPAADVFSLGVAVVQCASGIVPANGNLEPALRGLSRHGLSRKLRQLLAACVNGHASQRPRSAALADAASKALRPSQAAACRRRLAAAAKATFAATVGRSQLHCSPSFSMSAQGSDLPTPGSRRPASAALRQEPSSSTFDPDRPWASLFARSGRIPSGVPTSQSPAPFRRVSDCSGRPEVPRSTEQLLALPSTVGTPPSVAPKEQQHHYVPRINSPPSTHSLRFRALSFASGGGGDTSMTLERQPSVAMADSSSELASIPALPVCGAASGQPSARVMSRQPSRLEHSFSNLGLCHSSTLCASGTPTDASYMDGLEVSPRADLLSRYFSSQPAVPESFCPPGEGGASHAVDAAAVSPHGSADGQGQCPSQDGTAQLNSRRHEGRTRMRALQPLQANVQAAIQRLGQAPARGTKGSTMLQRCLQGHRHGPSHHRHEALDENLQSAANRSRLHCRSGSAPDPDISLSSAAQSARVKSRGTRLAGLVTRQSKVPSAPTAGEAPGWHAPAVPSAPAHQSLSLVRRSGSQAVYQSGSMQDMAKTLARNVTSLRADRAGRPSICTKPRDVTPVLPKGRPELKNVTNIYRVFGQAQKY